MRRPELLAGAILAAGVALIPPGYLLVRTLEAGLAQVVAEILTPRVAAMTVRTLALAAVVLLGSLAIGVTGALLVTRTDIPGRRTLGVLLAMPLAVPSYVAAFTWSATADLWWPGRFEGFWAAALVLTLYSFPYVYLPTAAALAGQDPALAEVARSLGHSEGSVLWRVTLRGVSPAIASGSLLVALYTLSDFGAVSILRLDTFTRAVFTTFSVGFDRTGAVALASMLMLWALVFIIVEGAATQRGARYARVGGGARRQMPTQILGSWRWPAFAGVTAVLACSLGVPLVALLRWTLAGSSDPGSATAVLTATISSVAAAGLGAALTIALAIPLGLYAVRVGGRFARSLERLVFVSHSLPGVVIGLSLVFFGINVAYPLYQSIWLLALAYAVLFLPLAVSGVSGAAAHASTRLEETGQALGLSPMRALTRVALPLLLPGIGAGAAMAFLVGMKELPATLLLRPTGLDTLATRLWTHTGVGEYAAAAPYAALLIALAALPTWLLARRTGALGVTS